VDGKDAWGWPPISMDLSVHNKHRYNYADRDARSVRIYSICTMLDSVAPKIKPCCTHDVTCEDIK
jgi:hypothetical protein